MKKLAAGLWEWSQGLESKPVDLKKQAEWVEKLAAGQCSGLWEWSQDLESESVDLKKQAEWVEKLGQCPGLWV